MNPWWSRNLSMPSYGTRTCVSECEVMSAASLLLNRVVVVHKFQAGFSLLLRSFWVAFRVFSPVTTITPKPFRCFPWAYKLAHEIPVVKKQTGWHQANPPISRTTLGLEQIPRNSFIKKKMQEYGLSGTLRSFLGQSQPPSLTPVNMHVTYSFRG